MENYSNLYLSCFKNSLFEQKYNFDLFSGKINIFNFSQVHFLEIPNF